MFYRTTTSS